MIIAKKIPAVDASNSTTGMELHLQFSDQLFWFSSPLVSRKTMNAWSVPWKKNYKFLENIIVIIMNCKVCIYFSFKVLIWFHACMKNFDFASVNLKEAGL